MNNVEFNEPPSVVPRQVPVKGLSGLLIRAKLARDERAANALLLIAALLALTATALLWGSGFVGTGTHSVSPSERDRLEKISP